MQSRTRCAASQGANEVDIGNYDLASTFSLFRWVETFAGGVQDFHVPSPHDFDVILDRMHTVKETQKRDRYPS